MYRREAPTPTFHSNIGTGLPDTKCHTSFLQLISTKRKTGDCELFELLDIMITNDARCTYEIKCSIARAKEGSFHQQIQIQIWRIATSDAETWTLKKQDTNTGKVLKCGAGEGWRRSAGPIM